MTWPWRLARARKNAAKMHTALSVDQMSACISFRQLRRNALMARCLCLEPAIGLEPMTCRLRTTCQPYRSPCHRAKWARIVRDRFTRPATVSLNGPSFAEKMHGAFFFGPAASATARVAYTARALDGISARRRLTSDGRITAVRPLEPSPRLERGEQRVEVGTG
jgi:hypothetical protein